MDEARGLVIRCADNDAEALAALYDRFGADVYRLARRLLLSPDAAEDVTQETFLRVWRAAGSFRQGSVRAWLVRIALNLSRDALRRDRRAMIRIERKAATMTDNPGTAPPDPAPALARLPAAERTTIVLKYYEGLTVPQVAAALGVSLRTAKYRAARGLEHLRRILDHD